MPLTDRETIRKIIQADSVIIPNVRNDRLVLEGTENTQLSFSNLDEDSESIKISQANTPHTDSHNPITLNANVPVNLDFQKIVWDSIVIAADAFGTVIYVENLDYVIDYFNGTLLRSSGSSIPDGGNVYAFYLPFTVLTKDVDYTIDYDFGQIARRSSGDIPDGATIFADYSHSQSTVTDSAIDEAISQAEAFINTRLRSGFDIKDPDEGLKSAASFFVVYNLCLAKSFQELNVASRDISDDLAKQWQNLAGQYLDIANSYFAKYLDVGTLQAGGLIQNRFVQNRARIIQSPPVPRSKRRY